jgi:negative regulator of genetic competence, sporulation and motility
MEWIRIGTHKLKIILSAADAQRYALDCGRADYAEAPIRRAFKEILTDMQQETGFDAGDDRLYIQMYPSKAGGCELFVTKMGLSATEAPQRRAVAELPLLPRAADTKRRASAFSFSRLEELLQLCRQLAPIYKGDSEIWQDERGGWWLLLAPREDAGQGRKQLRFVREYGRARDADKAALLLAEHGKRICGADAVRTFARF